MSPYGISQITGLLIEDVTPYLVLTGWRRVEHPNEKLMVFERGETQGNQRLRLVLTARDDFEDTPKRILEALHVLAALENRSPASVVNSIHSLDRDIVRQRIMTAGEEQSIPLQIAPKLVEGLRDLVAYAACVEKQPVEYFAKATSAGREFAEACRFGHTFPGSFGLTVEVPMPMRQEQSLPGLPASDPPFERRVTQRLVRGLKRTEQAALHGDPQELAGGVRDGFNANMCEVLLNIWRDSHEAELEFAVSWSPVWVPASDASLIEPVRLRSKSFQYLEAAARTLRRVRESSTTDVAGRIVQLRSMPPPTPDQLPSLEEQRTVQILWEADSGHPIRLHVELTLEQYRQACDAHRDGRRIAVRGRPEKQGKNWILMAPEHFRIEP